MSPDNTFERRASGRHPAPPGAYVHLVSQDDEATGFLVDLNMAGASFEYIFVDERLPAVKRVDIVSDRDKFSIQGIPFRPIFDIQASEQELEPVIWRRMGIQFGELSEIHQKNLSVLINRHWGYPASQPAAPEAAEPPGTDSDIFAARLKFLVIAAKAYLKGYPYGQYRENAISRNAREILKGLPHQEASRLGAPEDPFFKEQIAILAKAFSRFPVESRERAAIEKSVEYVSRQLRVERSLAQMDFLKVA
jgi:hypothetical protein